MPLRKIEVPVSLCLKISVIAAILLAAQGDSATSSSIQKDEFYYSKDILRGHTKDIDVERDVFFELYTRKNPEIPEIMDIVSISQNITRPIMFDPQKPVKICVHGWRSSSKKMMIVGRAFLAKGDYNLIMMNWVKVDSVLYPVARMRVQQLGKCLAHFLDDLVNMYRLNVTDFHALGFSLGAHIVGEAGRNTQTGLIGRITGLDPAGPLFKGTPDTLSYDAANFVDVIHTCGRIFGYWEPMGHVDFYPNGGNFQPGCLLNPRPSCSHNRVRELFAESLFSQKGFWAWPYTNGPQGIFPTNMNKVLMGYPVDKSARGVYYLTTSRQSPYAVCPPFEIPECPNEINKNFVEIPDLLLDNK